MEPQPLPLKDIHLPDAVSAWPPALGWWLVVIFAILFIAGCIYLYIRVTRKTALKAAKKQLENIKQNNELTPQQTVQSLSILLRRVVISNAPREQVANLTGRDWLVYLDGSLQDPSFSQGVGRCLADAHYQKTPPAIDIPQLIELCEHWLKAQQN